MVFAGLFPTDGEDYHQATIVLHAPRPSWLPRDSSWVLIHPAGGVLILPTTPPSDSCRLVAQVEEAELPRWRDASTRELRGLLSRRR